MPATKTDNMLSSLRLGVIERLALSFWAGTLPEDVDRIPLLMRPRGSEIMSRCCIYKDRAILRERLRAAMGFRLEDETDDSPRATAFIMGMIYICWSIRKAIFRYFPTIPMLPNMIRTDFFKLFSE